MNEGATLSALRSRNWRTLAAAGFLLALWEAASLTVARGSLFFPSPADVAAAGASLLKNGTLLRHWGATAARLAAGFLLGAVPAVGAGLWLGTSRQSREALDPLLAAAHAVPKIAAYPLFLILFGIGEKSKVAVIAAATFFPLAINTTAGVEQLPRVYFEVAKNYGASAAATFRRVVLPGSLPMILTGARIAMTLSLMLAIAVEIIGSRSGLGYLVWLSWEAFRVADLYVALLACAATGIGIRILFDRIGSILLPGKAASRG